VPKIVIKKLVDVSGVAKVVRGRAHRAALARGGKWAKIWKKYTCKFRLYQFLLAYEEQEIKVSLTRCADHHITGSNASTL